MIFDAQNTFCDKATLVGIGTGVQNGNVIVNGGGNASNPMWVYAQIENPAAGVLEVTLLSDTTTVATFTLNTASAVKKMKLPYEANGKEFKLTYKATTAFSSGVFTAALVADVDLP
ncbi:hypothetical protein LJC10_05800 [Selenomonadales bacterium OttesenSCG-928-I06]|nr:hypothetical protein [Selenomonadales bacterium OttesenSCG-928-I06]